MPTRPEINAFLAFVERSGSEFSKISRKTRGEWSPGDVRNEAWLIAVQIGQKRGTALDAGNPEDTSALLAHLYNHCVRYGEVIVRHSTRLDHSISADSDGQHPLMNLLSADDGLHPELLLEASEEAVPEPEHPHPCHSPASAWLHLLQQFDHCMQRVAQFLLISPSWSYACCRRAACLAKTQMPLPQPIQTHGRDALRSWRSFKLPPRTSRTANPQLDLDFFGRPVQPDAGQLWLL